MCSNCFLVLKEQATLYEPAATIGKVGHPLQPEGRFEPFGIQQGYIIFEKDKQYGNEDRDAANAVNGIAGALLFSNSAGASGKQEQWYVSQRAVVQRRRKVMYICPQAGIGKGADGALHILIV